MACSRGEPSPSSVPGALVILGAVWQGGLDSHPPKADGNLFHKCYQRVVKIAPQEGICSCPKGEPQGVGPSEDQREHTNRHSDPHLTMFLEKSLSSRPGTEQGLDTHLANE